MKKILDVVILVLLLTLLCLNRGKFFGHERQIAKPSPEAIEVAPESAEPQVASGPGAVTLAEARELFVEATALRQKEDGLYEVLKEADSLGFILKSSPHADGISGFMGATPLVIALDKDYKVRKVMALKNEETPHFFELVKKGGLLDAWNGLLPAQVAEKQVDAISGATFSSKGVIGTMRTRMAAVKMEEAPAPAEAPPQNTSKLDRGKLAADIAFLLLIVASLVAFFRPGLFGRGRRWLMLASLIILGLWQGRMLSMAQFTVWVVHGIPVTAQWAILMMFFLAILLPIVFGKAYYCAWLCPMGAAQVLLGELNKNHKLKIAAGVIQWLQMLRTAILFGVLLTVALGASFDFADFEAFTVFRPQSAPLAALVIGGLSLVLSIWMPRPWCRFLCPLGELLETVRRKREKKLES